METPRDDAGKGRGCMYIYAQCPWFAVAEAKALALVGYSTRTLLSVFPSVKGVNCCGLGFGNILKQVLCEGNLRFTVGSLSCVSKPGTRLDVKSLLGLNPSRPALVASLTRFSPHSLWSAAAARFWTRLRDMLIWKRPRFPNLRWML